MNEIYIVSEYIVAWGVLVGVGILNFLLFFLLSFSEEKRKDTYIIYRMKYIFLTKGLAMLTLSIMPIVAYTHNLTIKKVFETTTTMLYIIIFILLLDFVARFIKFLQVNKK